MYLEEIVNNLRCENNEYAIFSDSIGEIHIVEIIQKNNAFLSLKSRTKDGDNSGYMNLYFHPNNRIFLDTIYCYDKFRGRNIASNLSILSDYLLQEYEEWMIRGAYEPGQLSTDRLNNIYISKENLNDRAINFYLSNGYRIIEYKDYIKNTSKYAYINEENDFQLGEEKADIIVVKFVKKYDYLFEIKNGFIIKKEESPKTVIRD